MDKSTTHYYLVSDPKAMKSLRKNRLEICHHLVRVPDSDKQIMHKNTQHRKGCRHKTNQGSKCLLNACYTSSNSVNEG